MKRVSQLTALALLMGLAASTPAPLKPCQRSLSPPATAARRRHRHPAERFYNGWPQRANGPEGHEPQALNLSARWLSAMSDDQLSAWAKQHQLQADTPIALYGSPEDNVSVAARLKQTGFTRLSTLSDALSQTDRLQKLPHFEQLVYPQWLHDLQQGKAVAAAPAGDWKVFEAAWGAPKFYLLSHIPARAISIPTRWRANRCGIKSPTRS
jgi:thiosulfate/3-mercaptopyruvate sulfurtransferase